VTPLVAGAVPVLLLLVATTTWITAGRALRPVERMRREVDAVTAQRLDRRLDTSGPADEVGRLAVTMNSMLDRLDESQRAQRRFISDASHELKSPLASIRQYAEVAKLHPDRVTQTELTDAVLDEGSRLEKIVHSMLLLAHADEHDLGHTPVAVDLDDILFAEAARLRASTAITVDASGIGAARTSGDAELLGQVVRNLADNAATHAAGLVALALAEGADVVITIDDDGPGIPAGDRDRVFERFVRLDDARARDAGGSGLGLAIVREIVASHGGTVHLSGSPLGGLRVEVHLPRDAS
jgi:signal transduction histidine kinase